MSLEHIPAKVIVHSCIMQALYVKDLGQGDLQGKHTSELLATKCLDY